MNLENIYPIDFKKINLLDRKTSITSDKTLLIGVRGSGKSSILINYLKEFKKESFLYLDFDDERIDKDDLSQNLDEFIKKNRIEILVIENFDYSIKLPNTQKILLTSTELKKLSGFLIKEVFPLDFEEYISFDKRHLEAIHSFNSFLKDGSFPEIYFTNPHQKIKKLQSIIKNLVKDEVEFLILKQLILSSGFATSPFQIFTNLKKKIKLSKDRFYAIIEKFLSDKIIFFVPKYNNSKANKKLYLIDFSLKNAISFNRNFPKEFENMVFLELLKKQKKFYFTDFLDFFLVNEKLAILTISFITKELLENKIKNIKEHLVELNIKNIKVITINEEFKFKVDEVLIEVIPFWIWAIQD